MYVAFVKFELGFCPSGGGVSKKSFDKIKNRTEITKKGVFMFDRALSAKFLVIFLPETSLFLGVASLSPRLAGAMPKAGD